MKTHRVAYWRRERRSILEFLGYSRWHGFDTWEEVQREGVFMSVGLGLMNDGLVLVALGEDEVGCECLRRAEKLLDKAEQVDDVGWYARSAERHVHEVIGGIEVDGVELRTLHPGDEGYEEGIDDSGLGRAERAHSLYTCRWVLTGERDEGLRGLAVSRFQGWLDERLALPKQAPERTRYFSTPEGIGRTFVPVCVELGELELAKHYYRKCVERPISIPPAGRKWVEDFEHVAYLVAVHFSGEQQIAELARDAMERHYRYMERWMTVEASTYELGTDELAVAYIRGKYFRDETDPVALLKQMVRDSM